MSVECVSSRASLRALPLCRYLDCAGAFEIFRKAAYVLDSLFRPARDAPVLVVENRCDCHVSISKECEGDERAAWWTRSNLCFIAGQRAENLKGSRARPASYDYVGHCESYRRGSEASASSPRAFAIVRRVTNLVRPRENAQR